MRDGMGWGVHKMISREARKQRHHVQIPPKPYCMPVHRHVTYTRLRATLRYAKHADGQNGQMGMGKRADRHRNRLGGILCF